MGTPKWRRNCGNQGPGPVGTSSSVSCLLSLSQEPGFCSWPRRAASSGRPCPVNCFPSSLSSHPSRVSLMPFRPWHSSQMGWKAPPCSWKSET